MLAEAPLVERVRACVVARRDRGGLVAGERGAIASFLDNYDRLADPLDESADPTHVTGSAIVIGAPGVLLLKHKRLHRWLQPGGHLDPGETPWDAAVREAIEETGIELELDGRDAPGDPNVVHVDVHAGGRGHLHLDLRYVVRPISGADITPRPPRGESQQVRWWSPTEAVSRADDPRLAALLSAMSTAGVLAVDGGQ